jgi:dethiobiotin synthetase
MNTRIIVTGTDTGIGKTVFAAGLAGMLDGVYWKPIQAGVEEETDRGTVLRLSGLSPDRILPEAYVLRTPASPHLAAERDGIVIDPDALILPDIDRSLVVEGAGGLMVPLNRKVTYVDLMARWNARVVLCARTKLGTINHSLLSVEALRNRSIAIAGIVFIGDENQESERIIAELGQVRHLGRLPYLDPLTGPSLRAAFARHFRIEDFLQEAA